jgi:hypothetical protein
MDLGNQTSRARCWSASRRSSPRRSAHGGGLRGGDRHRRPLGFTERQTEIIETLKRKARAEGLWNFFLTEGEHSSGLSTVEYAYLAEEMGRSTWRRRSSTARRRIRATWKCWSSTAARRRRSSG